MNRTLVTTSAVLALTAAFVCAQSSQEARTGRASSGRRPAEQAADTAGKDVRPLYDFEGSTEGWEPFAIGDVRPRPSVASADYSSTGKQSLRVEVSAPAVCGASAKLPAGKRDWSRFTHLMLSIYTPPQAPPKSQLVVYVKDAELSYYQHVRKNFLRHGDWTHLRIDLTDNSNDWEYQGHYKPWDGYCRQDVLELGVKFLSQDKYEGPFYVDNVRLTLDPKAVPKENAIYNLRASETEVGQYEKFELSFNLARTYSNPFDPDVVNVQASFVCPDGRRVVVPGFFYQGYLRQMEKGAEKLVPMGRSQWKVRFAPRQPGAYLYQVRVSSAPAETGTGKEETVLSEMGRFRCVEGKNHGFVRISKKDKFCFEFDDGTVYYPIGHNIAAVFDARAKPMQVNIPAAEGTYAYDRMLKRMAEAGENFGRVWMSPWSFGIEWTKAYDVHYRGLGRYNLYNAWRLDHVLRTAEESSIYVLLLFTAHGEIGDYESDFWGHDPQELQGSPYWNGVRSGQVRPGYNGPLNHPLELYTSRPALEAYKKKARYIVARWGYSRAVMSWELLNEADLPQSYHNETYGALGANFVRSVARHVREVDAAEHLITSGCFYYKAPWAAPTLSLKEVDFNTGHVFQPQLEKELQSDITYMQKYFQKIFLPTEAGLTPFAQDADETALAMHRTIWSSFMTTAAGTAAPWWWVLIEKKNLYPHFAALTAFAKGEDRRNKNYEPTLVSSATPPADFSKGVPFAIKDNAGERVLMLLVLNNETEGFCWVCEPAAFASRIKQAEMKSAKATIKVSGFKAGSYRIQFWDTLQGKAIGQLDVETPKVENAEEGITFETPEFAGDLAVKIKPK